MCIRDSREGDVYIAMRVTGHSYNILKLDFSPAGPRYISDRAPLADVSVTYGSVSEQVREAFHSLGVNRASVRGVVFDSRDTPSVTIYQELAKAIIRYRNFGQSDVFISGNDRIVRGSKVRLDRRSANPN